MSSSSSVVAMSKTSSFGSYGGGDYELDEGLRAREAVMASCIWRLKAKSRSESRVLAAKSSLGCSKRMAWTSFSSIRFSMAGRF